jgi:hypothetical protein
VIDGEAQRIRILQLQVDRFAADRARFTGSHLLRDTAALPIPDRLTGERHGYPFRLGGSPGPGALALTRTTTVKT